MRTLDFEEIQSITRRNQNRVRDFLDRMTRYQDDTEKTQRESQGVCGVCWYLFPGRIGGAAMTAWQCGICREQAVAASTATDRVCLPCSKNHQLCTRCGGDQHGRLRKKVKF